MIITQICLNFCDTDFFFERLMRIRCFSRNQFFFPVGSKSGWSPSATLNVLIAPFWAGFRVQTDKLNSFQTCLHAVLHSWMFVLSGAYRSTFHGVFLSDFAMENNKVKKNGRKKKMWYPNPKRPFLDFIIIYKKIFFHSRKKKIFFFFVFFYAIVFWIRDKL